jgi:hypothetical protein
LVFSVGVARDLEPMGLPTQDQVQQESHTAQSYRTEVRGGRGEEKLSRPHGLPGYHPRSTSGVPPPQSNLSLPTVATRYIVVAAHLHVRLAYLTTI